MLGQRNGFVDEIASYLDAKEPMCRPKVSHPVLLVYLFFKPTNQLPRTSSYHAVINMNCENDDVSPDFPEKYSTIRLPHTSSSLPASTHTMSSTASTPILDDLWSHDRQVARGKRLHF